MVKMFRLLRESLLMVKVCKFSIKSEATIQFLLCYKKAVLKMSQKKTFGWASFQIKLRAYSLELLLKKASVHVFSSTFYQIFYSAFLAKHVRVTPSAKYPFVCHVNLSHKMLPLTLFFPFYFKYFQHKHFSFLKVLDN